MTLSVIVARRWPAAEGITAFDLRSPDGGPMPPFTAGAHIDVHLPGGFVRHYSIVSDETQRDHYVVAVQHEAAGRGGSAAIHALSQGASLDIAPPRNTFELIRETATPVLLVAGGIGVTPLLSMARALAGRGDVHLHYVARTASRVAFADELAAGVFGPCTIHVGTNRLDPKRLAAEAADGTRVYLCGPPRFMTAIVDAFASRRDVELRSEHFAAPVAASDGPASDTFVVDLAQSGRSLTIAPGRSILDEMRAIGMDPLVSCEQGVCGTCATRVLAGAIEHRDYVLSTAEQATGDCMMICVSRGRPGTTLVLDL